MSDIFVNFYQSLLDPARMLLDPHKRVYWLFLLGSMGVIVLLSKKQDIGRHLALLVSPRIWFHRSSRLDLKLVIVSGLLRPFILPVQLTSVAAVAAFVSWANTKIWGPISLEGAFWPIVAVAYTFVSFIADDFSRFLLHYGQHRISFLWSFHQVHHSAEVLTPLSLYRTHPVDIVCSRLRHILCHGLVTGIFFYFFHQQLSSWDILGANAFAFVFNSFGANLRHSHIPIHFGTFERIFISPLAHQVHHSLKQEHYDKNFGSCFAIWDQWLDTHIDGRKLEGQAFSFGLEKPSFEPYSLCASYIRPFQVAFKTLSSPTCSEAKLYPKERKPIESPASGQG